MNNLNVIILSGGVSSRFWPLSEKNVYRFFGNTPFDFQINRIKKLNPKKTIIVTNGKIEVNFPNCISIPQTGSGMAGGVITALKEIDPDDEVLIIGANDYYNKSLFSSFNKLRGKFFKNKEFALAGCKVENYFPGGYLKLRGETITGIVEKPARDNIPSDYVNMVFHYFPTAKNLAEALSNAKSSNDDLYEVALDDLMKSNHVFKMIEYQGNWKSIKYPWNVLDVMDFYLEQIKGQKISSKTDISKKAVIKGNVIIEEGAKIFEGAVINGPVYIGKNSVIANNTLVRNSMIGEDCVIGYGSEVARSYFKNNVWLHKNYVGDSVFESNISLGSGTITGNLRLDEQNIKIDVKGNEVNTNKNKLGAIIGSNVRIGINVSIMPGVRIGSNSFVGPAVLLDKDVPNDTFVKNESKYMLIPNTFDITKTSREEIKKKI